VLEIVYNSDESINDSNSDSVSSSNNEINDIAVADSIINDSDDKEEILHRDFRWKNIENYTGHIDVFSCDLGPRNAEENVTLYVLSCFLTKKSYNLSEKLIGTQNNTRAPLGNLVIFRSLVRLWTRVTESEI
jgi:hypothetical protein